MVNPSLKGKIAYKIKEKVFNLYILKTFSTNEIAEKDQNPEHVVVKVTFVDEATQTSNEHKLDTDPEQVTLVKATQEKATQMPENEILCFQIEKGSVIAWGKIGFDVFVNFVLQAVDEGTDLYSGIRYIL